MLSSTREWQFDLTVKSDAATQIKQIVRSENIDLIWCVTNSSSIISLMDHLLEEISTPVVTMVWDTPQHFVLGQHLDRLTAQILKHRFAQVLHKSERVSVTGSAMQRVFWRDYGIDSVSIVHGINRDLWHAGLASPRVSNELIIVFAGSLYAKREWNALLDAVETTNAIIAKRRVVIRYFGQFPRTGVRKAPFVEFMGTLPPDVTLRALSGADIAYLPYWFDEKYSYVVRTSFPSKLSTYLAAGLPVLYHGPKDSSPTEFFSVYPVGLCCHSHGAKDISENLERLATDDALIRSIVDARRYAQEQELSLDVMLQRFATLINVDYHQLVPLSSAAS